MEDEAENTARLAGLLAMLALPLVRAPDGRMKRRPIEVEYEPGRWMIVEAANVESGRLTLWSGSNGTRVSREFQVRCCPRWRCETPTAYHFVSAAGDPMRSA